jgi:hypothetical protein
MLECQHESPMATVSDKNLYAFQLILSTCYEKSNFNLMCIFGIVRTYVATRHTIYLSYQSKTIRMRHFSHHSLPDSVGTRRILERVPDAPRGCQPPEVAGQGTQSRTVLQPRRASLLGRVSHGNDVGSVETVVVGNYARIGQGVCLDKIDVVKRLGRKCSCVSSKNCDCNDDRCSVV